MSAAKSLIERMRKLIPRQMFEVALQAAIGNKIVSRENHPGHSQERAGQVLWRRHFAQTQTARNAKGREEAHEARRPCGYPAGGFPGRAAGGHGRKRLAAHSDCTNFP